MGPGLLNSERMQVHNLRTQRSPFNYNVCWLGWELEEQDCFPFSPSNNVIL